MANVVTAGLTVSLSLQVFAEQTTVNKMNLIFENKFLHAVKWLPWVTNITNYKL